MMTAATFGDLLGPARGHLGCAAGFPDSVLRGESAVAAAGVTGRLALTLSRYLADIAPYGMAEAITNRSLRPRIGAAVDAREALRMAVAALRAAAAGTHSPGGEPAAPAAAGLAAAGDSLAAGRDLLRTHFATSPDGEWVPRSEWSAVISSAPGHPGAGRGGRVLVAAARVPADPDLAGRRDGRGRPGRRAARAGRRMPVAADRQRRDHRRAAARPGDLGGRRVAACRPGQCRPAAAAAR